MITTFREWLFKKENKIDEAISISQYRPYSNIKPFPKYEKMLDAMFGSKQRIEYYPTPSVAEKSKLELEVTSFLDSIGFTVEDYIGNQCKKKGDFKNVFKISKILNKENQELYKKYIADQDRSVQDISKSYKIVLSRHPYDIVGASTGRSWESCLTIGGEACDKLKGEIKGGSFVAYCVAVNDNNLNNPYCRVFVRRFENKEEERDYYVVSSMVYGNAPKDFLKNVEDFVYKIQRKPVDGHYEVNKFSHPDKNWAVIIQNGKVFKV